MINKLAQTTEEKNKLQQEISLVKQQYEQILVERSKQTREPKPPKPAPKKAVTVQSELDPSKRDVVIQQQSFTQSPTVLTGTLGPIHDKIALKPSPIMPVDHSQKTKPMHQTESSLQTPLSQLTFTPKAVPDVKHATSTQSPSSHVAPQKARYLLPVREGRSIERMNAGNKDFDDLDGLDSQVLQNKITQDEYNARRAEKVRKHIDETVLTKKESETQCMLSEILKLKEEIQEVSESFRVLSPHSGNRHRNQAEASQTNS